MINLYSIIDLSSWLKLYGYDIKNILGSVYTKEMVYQPTAKVTSPQLAPDFGVMSGLQCIIEKVIQPIVFFLTTLDFKLIIDFNI